MHPPTRRWFVHAMQSDFAPFRVFLFHNNKNTIRGWTRPIWVLRFPAKAYLTGWTRTRKTAPLAAKPIEVRLCRIFFVFLSDPERGTVAFAYYGGKGGGGALPFGFYGFCACKTSFDVKVICLCASLSGWIVSRAACSRPVLSRRPLWVVLPPPPLGGTVIACCCIRSHLGSSHTHELDYCWCPPQVYARVAWETCRSLRRLTAPRTLLPPPP